MWVDKQPKEHDTVKVKFAEHTNLGTKIGIIKKFHDGKVKIEFGDCVRWLDMNTTFFVYKK